MHFTQVHCAHACITAIQKSERPKHQLHLKLYPATSALERYSDASNFYARPGLSFTAWKLEYSYLLF